jgi:DNA primase
MFGVADDIAKEYLKRAKLKDRYISAICPFHKGGQERHPSFWVDRETGAWGCFTCPARGGSLRQLLRDLKVGNWKIEAEIAEAEKDAKKTSLLSKAKAAKKAKADFHGVHTLPDAVLGVFDFCPVGLLEQGFTEKTLIDHEVGFDKRNNRITFPIRDIYGTLIGISGRSTTPGEIPKYLVYSGRRNIDGVESIGELGEWYPDYSNEGVRDHLWGGQTVYDRLFNESGQLVIVEGYKAKMWVTQHGYDAVAIMGTKLTSTQERIIRRLGAEVFVFPDNNEPGRDAARQWCQRLAVSSFPVFQVNYPEYCDENAQPDGLSEQELDSALNSSKRAGGKFHGHVRKQLGKNQKQGHTEKFPWRRGA